MSTTAGGTHQRPAGTCSRRLPVISHFNKSVGLQRGMLVAGCPDRGLPADRGLRAADRPFGFSQFPTPTAASAAGARRHLWGTTVGSYDVFSRVVWGRPPFW